MASERPLPSANAYEYPPYTAYPDDDDTQVVEAVPRRKRRWPRVLLALLLLVALIVAVSGAVLYENPTLLSPLGSMVLGTQSGVVPWNGQDPLNILVMGIDQRTNEQTRSDTMMVLRVDPSSHDVKMLSVPRDLWVSIPSADLANPYGYYKINAAYALGGAHGPQWAQLTVESALHIPINYYAVLRFSGFQSVVDALGGVNVCVPKAIDDPTYPAPVGYGFDPLHIKAGCQDMDGTLALKYARERHVDTEQDLGRIQQQQALMTAIEKKLLSPGTIFRTPAIISAVNSATITNLPHSALPLLGYLLGRAKGDHTQHAYINVDGGYVADTWSSDGQNILAPNWPKINGLISSLFPNPQLRAENATVQVQNGQHTVGLARLYTDVLNGIGFNTVAPANADTNLHIHNQIITNVDRPDAPYTARLLAQMFQAKQLSEHLGANGPQVAVIVGSQAVQGS